MKSLLEILKLSTDYLHQRGVLNARRQAQELISDALGISRLDLYLEYDRPLTEPELERCRAFLKRRGHGEPLPYIRGHVDFLDTHLKVTSSVLIPRQETEILVDKIARELSGEMLAHKTLWDICCGSGCIGIALKKKFPTLNVVLSDLSSEALNVAKENAATNQVEITFVEGDLLQPFKGQQADYIVCNPPYVSESEFQQLEIEVRQYEPRLALVAGESGLEVYARMAREINNYLAPGGKAWFEIGKGQGQAVKSLFTETTWKVCRVEQDWAGHDRFFFLERE